MSESSTIRLYHLEARVPPGLTRDLAWQKERALEGRERVRAARRLAEDERRRRRDQWFTHKGKRLDVHGQHRVVVEVCRIVRFGDWVDDKAYDTIRLKPQRRHR